ncbi:hypothetical protein F4779DRAFT_617936 [Xylariaceae sp. FL0662B]|nr:hypothetical protein F4779DRAFT_617936 [Xylariaceae sp. FL0662B]
MGPDTVKVIVGPEEKEFLIPKKLLTSCRLFLDEIDAARLEFAKGQAYLVVELEDQCPDMFELLCYWLNNERKGFDKVVDTAEAERTCDELHWDFVNLHIFAAQVELPALQDYAMDAIQDIYLRCNWDVNPRLIDHVYRSCDPQESCRLRKWIVAMTAWTLSGVVPPDLAKKIQRLFETCPDFLVEYNTHTRKMTKSGNEGPFKNPQLRLPSNNLRNGERQFGFRQCSFHTHRSRVGQGKCPHTRPPQTDASLESDSERCESLCETRCGSRCESRFGSRMVSPSSDTIHESDLEMS